MCAKIDKIQRRRHYFFLSPYEDMAFTCCPKCNQKTKLRKFPLVIHVDPAQILCINKKCKYCEQCDLIVAKKSEVESLMVMCCENRDPALVGNKYLVVGTLDKADWRNDKIGTTESSKTIEKAYIFKDVLEFEIIQGGWVKDK